MNKKEFLEKQEKLKKNKEPNLIEVKMPSGQTWIHKEFDISLYALSTGLPLHLLSKLPSVKNQPQKELTDEQIAKIGEAAMKIIGDVLLNKLVYPKVSVEETEDSITPDQLDIEDFKYFKAYIVSGGQVNQVVEKKIS